MLSIWITEFLSMWHSTENVQLQGKYWNYTKFIVTTKACQSRWRRQIRKLDYFTQGYTPIATRNKRRNNQGLPLTTTAHLQTKGKAEQATPTGKYASHLILK